VAAVVDARELREGDCVIGRFHSAGQMLMRSTGEPVPNRGAVVVLVSSGPFGESRPKEIGYWLTGRYGVPPMVEALGLCCFMAGPSRIYVEVRP